MYIIRYTVRVCVLPRIRWPGGEVLGTYTRTRNVVIDHYTHTRARALRRGVRLCIFLRCFSPHTLLLSGGHRPVSRSFDLLLRTNPMLRPTVRIGSNAARIFTFFFTFVLHYFYPFFFFILYVLYIKPDNFVEIHRFREMGANKHTKPDRRHV